MSNLSLREQLVARAREIAYPLPESALDQLSAYFELLKLWNRRLALTALPVEDNGVEALDRLLLEPAAAARFIPTSAKSLVDIGSGGGSPALPLKIIRPDVSLAMVESREKKSAFLREAIRHLGIQGATVDTARYEDLLKRPEMVGSADVATLRAVKVEAADLRLLAGFLRRDGLLMIFSTDEFQLGGGEFFEALGTHPLLPDRGSYLTILRRV